MQDARREAAEAGSIFIASRGVYPAIRLDLRLNSARLSGAANNASPGGNAPRRAMGMVPRGRVELPTPAFSGPRSTGELPRHRNN